MDSSYNNLKNKTLIYDPFTLSDSGDENEIKTIKIIKKDTLENIPIPQIPKSNNFEEIPIPSLEKAIPSPSNLLKFKFADDEVASLIAKANEKLLKREKLNNIPFIGKPAKKLNMHTSILPKQTAFNDDSDDDYCDRNATINASIDDNNDYKTSLQKFKKSSIYLPEPIITSHSEKDKSDSRLEKTPVLPTIITSTDLAYIIESIKKQTNQEFDPNNSLHTTLLKSQTDSLILNKLRQSKEFYFHKLPSLDLSVGKNLEPFIKISDSKNLQRLQPFNPKIRKSNQELNSELELAAKSINESVNAANLKFNNNSHNTKENSDEVNKLLMIDNRTKESSDVSLEESAMCLQSKQLSKISESKDISMKNITLFNNIQTTIPKSASQSFPKIRPVKHVDDSITASQKNQMENLNSEHKGDTRKIKEKGVVVQPFTKVKRFSLSPRSDVLNHQLITCKNYPNSLFLQPSPNESERKITSPDVLLSENHIADENSEGDYIKWPCELIRSTSRIPKDQKCPKSITFSCNPRYSDGKHLFPDWHDVTELFDATPIINEDNFEKTPLHDFKLIPQYDKSLPIQDNRLTTPSVNMSGVSKDLTESPATTKSVLSALATDEDVMDYKLKQEASIVLTSSALATPSVSLHKNVILEDEYQTLIQRIGEVRRDYPDIISVMLKLLKQPHRLADLSKQLDHDNGFIASETIIATAAPVSSNQYPQIIKNKEGVSNTINNEDMNQYNKIENSKLSKPYLMPAEHLLQNITSLLMAHIDLPTLTASDRPKSAVITQLANSTNKDDVLSAGIVPNGYKKCVSFSSAPPDVINCSPDKELKEILPKITELESDESCESPPPPPPPLQSPNCLDMSSSSLLKSPEPTITADFEYEKWFRDTRPSDLRSGSESPPPPPPPPLP